MAYTSPGFPPMLILAVFLCAQPALPQTKPTPQAPSGKSAAYYHAALGHLYAELAAQYGGRGEFLNKAIENYKLAMRADPEAGLLAQELSDLYLQSGMLASAQAEYEDAVKKNPSDVGARRVLGRFYMARIREGQQGRMNEQMLRKALEQYNAVAQLAPNDVDNWLLLGRLHKLTQNTKESEAAYNKVLEIDGDNEDALTGLAMVYSDLGDNAKASELLKRVTDRNPSLRTLTALAATYEQMKEYKLAAETYGRALAQNRENTDLKRAYAQALFAAEEEEEALKVFEELITEEPNDLLAALRLSQIHRERREFAKAREYAQRAKRLDPNNLEIQFNEVSLLEAEGKTQEAIQALREAIAGMPLRPDSNAERGNKMFLLERLGMLYRSAEQTDKAVSTFREIIDLDPTTGVRASAQIVDALRAGKDFKRAEQEAQAALKQYPGERLPKVVMANVLTDLGKFREAEQMLRSMLDGKSDRETWIAIAQIHEKSKNFSEMAKAINEAERLSQTDDQKEVAHFMRGAMFERMKKYEEAEAEFRKVLALNPKSASALNYLGYMLADRNIRLQEALELIQKAVDQDPHNSAYLDSLGWAYYRLNRYEEAEDYLNRSIQRGSRDGTVHDHLADVLASQGKLKEAIQQWERAIVEWQANAPSEVDPQEIAKIQKKLEGARIRLAKETSAPPQPQR
jgi:tetratricopeptide (TPR) repeat protein